MPLSALTIINSVFGILVADSVFLGHLGLTTASTMAEKGAKVQQEMDPVGLTKDNIPLVCIYPVPGVRSRSNQTVYDAMFEVAIYSNSSTGVKGATTKAGTMRIGDRVRTLLHQVQLAGATFLVEFQTDYQYASNVTDVKKYIMRFLVSEVIG